MEIVVLRKEEVAELLHEAARLAVNDLRADLEASRVRELMTMSQLCDYLGKHRSTIARFVENGMPQEMCGDHPIFRKSDIDLWLKGK